jgi:hypothetical protein
MARSAHKIFILSPARTSGKRASILLNPASEAPLAVRLRSHAGAPLEEVFSFCSSLYFRGKAVYANHFADSPECTTSAYVITSSSGLISSGLRITAATLHRFSGVPIDPADDRYLLPLLASARDLERKIGEDTQIVLLGSIASPKYSVSLLECFGERVLFPAEFIGRGDMSRGGLLLRAVAANQELAYQRLSTTIVRTGKRPPKLEIRSISGRTKHE